MRNALPELLQLARVLVERAEPEQGRVAALVQLAVVRVAVLHGREWLLEELGIAMPAAVNPRELVEWIYWLLLEVWRFVLPRMMVHLPGWTVVVLACDEVQPGQAPRLTDQCARNCRLHPLIHRLVYRTLSLSVDVHVCAFSRHVCLHHRHLAFLRHRTISISEPRQCPRPRPRRRIPTWQYVADASRKVPRIEPIPMSSVVGRSFCIVLLILFCLQLGVGM